MSARVHPIAVPLRAAKVLSLLVSLLLLAAVMPSAALCNVLKAGHAATMSACDKPCCPQQHDRGPMSSHNRQTQACDAHCSVPFLAAAEVTDFRHVAAEPMLASGLHLYADDLALCARTEKLSLDTRPPGRPALSPPLRI